MIGDAIENGLRAQGIHTDFIHLEQSMTRINVKIKSGQETAMNGAGPKISADALTSCLKSLAAFEAETS